MFWRQTNEVALMLIERATTHLLSWPSALAYESQLSRTHNARFNKTFFFKISTNNFVLLLINCATTDLLSWPWLMIQSCQAGTVQDLEKGSTQNEFARKVSYGGQNYRTKNVELTWNKIRKNYNQKLQR